MSSVSFIKFDRQSLKWARFGTVADQSSEFRVLFWFKVESREFSCHAVIFQAYDAQSENDSGCYSLLKNVSGAVKKIIICLQIHQGKE